MAKATSISVAYGDGIGPEIMEATLRILKKAHANLAIETIDVGEQVYLSGVKSGITDTAWESLRRTKVLLKAPITTPQGGGYKSLNVTMRKTLSLFANVRPCRSYAPFVATKHPVMNLVIIRENEEGTYGGIEHQQTPQVTQCLKLITVPGCERIIRYAFEYAEKNKRRKVTCFVKDNIMKITDGLFHKIFNQIAREFPHIENDHFIVDIGMARVAAKPELFDVIVVPNLYGDILSDIAAEIAGSVGMAGSANVGEHCAMFEAIHGSAPDIAGKQIANPSGLLMGAVMMLVHIGQTDVAETIHNAWLSTLEKGIHTIDIYNGSSSSQRVNTEAFADAVIEHLGTQPKQLGQVHYERESKPYNFLLRHTKALSSVSRELKGIDIFVYWPDSDPEGLQEQLQTALSEEDTLTLTRITNRGIDVWPERSSETFCVDQWCCRFLPKESQTAITHEHVLNVLKQLMKAQIEWIKTEGLYAFDGKAGWSV